MFLDIETEPAILSGMSQKANRDNDKKIDTIFPHRSSSSTKATYYVI